MARFFLCLCLVLTLWMGGSRRPAAIGSGSLRPGSLWGTRESQQIARQAARLCAAGDYAAAEFLYDQQLRIARERRDPVATVRFLLGAGGVRVWRRHYQAALAALAEARRIAQSIGDRLDLGAIDINLSSLYLQMWDVDAALSAAAEGVAASEGIAKTYYRHSALLQAGRLHQVLADGQAEPFLREGIEAARQQGDLAQEAAGWDYLGDEWRRRGHFADAERAFLEAFRIRVFAVKKDLRSSYARLGELRLAQGDLPSAARLTDLAIQAGEKGQSMFPEYLLLEQRGRIRLARGDCSGAIADFRAAVKQAISWRREALPASSVLATTNSELEKRIFDSFVETAAAEAITKNNPGLAAESFQAMEWNRAQSLREIVGLAEVWRKKLPPEYWQMLSNLHDARTEDARRNLALKLTEMEAEAGLSKIANQNENFRDQTSLISLRNGLSDSDLLLSFHLGSQRSYLWALTRHSLNLYALAPSAQIRKEIEEFRNDIRDGRGAGLSGSNLYRDLFGALSPAESNQPKWLLSLDDALFEAPLTALGMKGRYLIETHSLTVIPGALWLAGERGKEPSGGCRQTCGWFLGVSDPVYNTADPRRAAGSSRLGSWFAQASDAPMLNRLVASANEVEASERGWDSPRDVILNGDQARRGKFVALAAQSPAVIHLATHVLPPAGARAGAEIAFGLESSGRLDYLSTADVGMLHVPGAVVVMTGCDSGSGRALAGAGLIGLTRAWQAAGASAVISTLWPVRDSSGDLFPGFYRRLRTLPPAEALRQSQVEMIRSGAWRAQPRYWAAYQLTGGSLGR
jgi:CHAT domain-containing protein